MDIPQTVFPLPVMDVLLIVNSAVMNASAYSFAWACVFIHFTFTTRSILLGYLVDINVTFKKLSEFFPQWLCHFTFQQRLLLQCASSSHGNEAGYYLLLSFQ